MVERVLAWSNLVDAWDEVQARLMANTIQGKLDKYPPFRVR